MVDISCIWCDDFRREDNGKALIIGAYTDFIVVPDDTQAATLWLIVFIEGASPGEHVFSSQIKTDTGNTLSEVIDAKFTANNLGHATIPFYGVNIHCKENAIIQLWATVDGPPAKMRIEKELPLVLESFATSALADAT